MVQWSRLRLPLQGMQVQSLGRERRFHIPPGQNKKIKKKKIIKQEQKDFKKKKKKKSTSEKKRVGQQKTRIKRKQRCSEPLGQWLGGCSDKIQCSSVAQSHPTLCDPKDCSTPGLPVHHQLPELIRQSEIQAREGTSHPKHKDFSSPDMASAECQVF